MKASGIEVLAPEACPAVVAKVRACRPYWNRAGGHTEFYTLGVSAYLEAHDKGIIPYTLAARRQNPLLREYFGDLYDRVLAALVKVVGEPVEYHPRLALPGFQIFLPDPAFASPICSIHVDLPYREIDWRPYEEVDTARTMSFTLALQLPRAGGGLNVWPQIEPDIAINGPPGALQVKGLEPVLHPYSPGKMVVHDGHSMHQIAPFTMTEPDEARITLQGHGIRTPRGWLAYF